MSELIAGNNQPQIGPHLYNMERKNIFKPELKVKIKDSYKKEKLNKLIKKILEIDGDWKIENNIIKNSDGTEIEIKYGDKRSYMINTAKETKVISKSTESQDLFKTVHTESIKDGYQRVHVKKELDIEEKLDRIIEIYKERYVKEIKNKEDLIFIISAQGTGKTFQIVKQLVEAIQGGKNIIIVSNRISLGTTIYRNVMDAMKKVGMDVEADENKMYFYKKSNKKEISEGTSMIISPESLIRMMDDKMSLGKYDIIWIDECKKAMNDYGNSQTLNGIRKSSLDILEHYIKTCEKVYASDADMNEDVVSWIEKLRSPNRSTSRIIWNQEKTDHTETYIYETLKKVDDRLNELISSDKSVYLGYTSVKNAESTYNSLRKKYPSKKILKITGESAESTINKEITKMSALMNCNEEWKKYDIVITTPCIVFGTSFDEEHFDEVFYYYEGILTGELACQALHRVRKLKNNRINMHVPFSYRPYLVTEEEEYKRIMNGDIGLLKKLNIRESIRENILSSIGCSWDNEGNRIINTGNILYWMMIKTKMDENRSLKNIKWDIIEEICKNREEGIYLEIVEEEEVIEKKEEKEDDLKSGDNEEKEDGKSSRIVSRPNLSWEEYEKLKKKQDRNLEENETLRKNMLRYIYDYKDLDVSTYEKVNEVDKKWQGIMRYLRGNEGKIKDVTDLDGARILRERYEELLRIVGFEDGILSKNEIKSEEIKIEKPKELIEKLKDLQKKMKRDNIYRGSDEIKVSILLSELRMIGISLGLCDIDVECKKKTKSRCYIYKIEQRDEVKEVLKNMLKNIENKLGNKFRKELIRKISWSGMEESVEWYEEGCMID
jgi:late competence protein required for DNA uptake (superfamily II DNA/RNA helicase)